MKTFLVFMAAAVLTACHAKKQVEPTREERINQIAAPLIANEVGDLMILLNTAKTDPDQVKRADALDKIVKDFPEYISPGYLACVKKLNHPYADEIVRCDEFTRAVDLQKKFIEDKHRKYAADMVYKQDLMKEYVERK